MSREAQILQLKWQNFNFGLGSAPDPFTKLMTRPKVLLIGWLRALLWTLADVCVRILDSFQLLVSIHLKFFLHMGSTVLKLFRHFVFTSCNIGLYRPSLRELNNLSCFRPMRHKVDKGAKPALAPLSFFVLEPGLVWGIVQSVCSSSVFKRSTSLNVTRVMFLPCNLRHFKSFVFTGYFNFFLICVCACLLFMLWLPFGVINEHDSDRSYIFTVCWKLLYEIINEYHSGYNGEKNM